MGSGKKNKTTGGKKLADFFKRQPADPLGSYIQIFGSRTLLVEGCQGVLSYSEKQIKLSLGARSLLVLGADLTLSGMDGASVTVQGHITGTEFR